MDNRWTIVGRSLDDRWTIVSEAKRCVAGSEVMDFVSKALLAGRARGAVALLFTLTHRHRVGEGAELLHEDGVLWP